MGWAFLFISISQREFLEAVVERCSARTSPSTISKNIYKFIKLKKQNFKKKKKKKKSLVNML